MFYDSSFRILFNQFQLYSCVLCLTFFFLSTLDYVRLGTRVRVKLNFKFWHSNNWEKLPLQQLKIFNSTRFVIRKQKQINLESFQKIWMRKVKTNFSRELDTLVYLPAGSLQTKSYVVHTAKNLFFIIFLHVSKSQ